VIMRAQPGGPLSVPRPPAPPGEIAARFPVLGRKAMWVLVCEASLRPIQKNAFRPAP